MLALSNPAVQKQSVSEDHYSYHDIQILATSNYNNVKMDCIVLQWIRPARGGAAGASVAAGGGALVARCPTSGALVARCPKMGKCALELERENSIIRGSNLESNMNSVA